MTKKVKELKGTFSEYEASIKNARTLEQLDNNAMDRLAGKLTSETYGFTMDEDSGTLYKDFPWAGLKVTVEIVYKGLFSKLPYVRVNHISINPVKSLIWKNKIKEYSHSEYALGTAEFKVDDILANITAPLLVQRKREILIKERKTSDMESKKVNPEPATA